MERLGKRSIHDEEIALIRAMAARGIRNRDIQFYFNRPDRPVNSGRITQIKQGTYGPEAGTASDAELEKFLSDSDTSVFGTPSELEVGCKSLELSEFEIRLLALAKRDEKDGISFDLDEGLDLEFKSEFSKKFHAGWVRAVAAFANSRGGCILFGVDDKGRLDLEKNRVFQTTDIAQVCDQIRKYLTPTPNVLKKSMAIFGESVCYLEVEQAKLPPVIVQRDGDKLHEGTILYRYPGSSENIKAGDLLALLVERDRKSQAQLLDITNRISEIGPQNAVLFDAQRGTLDGRRNVYQLDQKLAEQLSFIHEGSFDEAKGAPTLKVIGDLMVGGGDQKVEVEKNLTAPSVLNDFLKQGDVANPLEYIRASLHTQRHWLPIFYFAKLAKATPEAVLRDIEEQQATYPSAKARLRRRLTGDLSAEQKCSGRPAEILQRMIAGEFPELADSDEEDYSVALAIAGLPDGVKVAPAVFALLSNLAIRTGKQTSRLSAVFRAACRVDELLYR